MTTTPAIDVARALIVELGDDDSRVAEGLRLLVAAYDELETENEQLCNMIRTHAEQGGCSFEGPGNARIAELEAQHEGTINWARRRIAALEESCRSLTSLVTENEHLKARQQELLQTLVNVTHSTPYPGEGDEVRHRAGVLIAEVGTLRARVANLEAQLKTCGFAHEPSDVDYD